MARRAVVALVVLLLVVIGVLPIIVMFGKSVIVDGRLSLEFYKHLLASRRAWILLRQSLMLASLTTVLTMAIGVPLGVLLGKTDLPFRRVLSILFAIPLLVPPYITAVAWFHILGREGLLAGWLGPSIAQHTSIWLFGLPGCVLVLSSTFLPIVMLLTMTFLNSVNPRLEEAGRLMSGWFTVLKGISVPLALPGILLAAALVFLLSLGEFSVPDFLRYDVFAVESFTQFSAFSNVSAATAAAVTLAIITLLILGVEGLSLRRTIHHLQPRPHGTTPDTVIGLGPFRTGLVILVSLLCCLGVLFPLLVLVIQAGSPVAYVQAWSRASDSLLRSLTYAAISASLLTVLGFLVGYLIHTRGSSYGRGLDFMTMFLLTIPSTVIGIGLITLWNRPSTAWIYATPVIVLLGYLAQYVALPSRITVSTLAQIPPSMEEAAKIVGARWVRRLSLIVAPLAGRGLATAWLVSYIFCLRDTGITMMVYPPGGDTLPVRIFTLMANSPSSLIAALCILMIVTTAIPLGVLGMMVRTARDAP